MLAAVFGIIESPITGYTYLSGATISLTGFIAAAYGGFRKPGRALLAGLVIGIVEALLGGYVSAQYGDTVLYAIPAPDEALFGKIAGDLVPGGLLVYTMPTNALANRLVVGLRRVLRRAG